MEFDAVFKNVISGTIYQYDEDDHYIDCYPLCDPDLPDENFKLQIDKLIFNQIYFHPIDDESKTETMPTEMLQTDSLEIMKTNAPETCINLLYVDDNSEKASIFNSDNLIRIIALDTISAFLRSMNIDSALRRKPFSLRKNVNPKKYLVHQNEKNFVEEYQKLK